MTDLCALDAISPAEAIRNREVSAVEARAAIARMDALEAMQRGVVGAVAQSAAVLDALG